MGVFSLVRESFSIKISILGRNPMLIANMKIPPVPVPHPDWPLCTDRAEGVEELASRVSRSREHSRYK